MTLRADPAEDLDRSEDLENQVHLWISFEETERSTSHLRHLLSAEEQAIAGRFQNVRDQRRYVVAHALIRLALSDHFPVAPIDWRFGRDRNNKPVVTAPEEFTAVRFSISHTSGLIACLVTRASEAGIDVEKIEPNEELIQVAQNVLSVSELQSLSKLSREDRVLRFFDLWTLKEAYGKARGVGLDLPLKAISFEIGSENSVRVRFDKRLKDDPASWIFWLRRRSSEHALSVAVRGPSEKNCELIERIVKFDESHTGNAGRLAI